MIKNSHFETMSFNIFSCLTFEDHKLLQNLRIESPKSTCYKIRFVGRKLSGISNDSKTYDFFISLSVQGV